MLILAQQSHANTQQKEFLGPCGILFFGGPGVLFTFCRWLEVLEFNRQSGGFNPTSSNFELQPTAAAPTTSLRFPTSLFKRRQC